MKTPLPLGPRGTEQGQQGQDQAAGHLNRSQMATGALSQDPWPAREEGFLSHMGQCQLSHHVVKN